jgi:hypothetical protein
MEELMRASRRRLLRTFSGAVVGSLLLRSQNPAAQTPTPRVRPPRSQGDTSDEPGNPPNAPNSSNKAILEQRQKDIKKEVEKLYKLASELKNEVEKTDATTVLSLPLLKKAEEIEKLAKQIKDNAKG